MQCVRKFECFFFDVASVQCGHPHSHQQVPFACIALRVASRVLCGLGLKFSHLNFDMMNICLRTAQLRTPPPKEKQVPVFETCCCKSENLKTTSSLRKFRNAVLGLLSLRGRTCTLTPVRWHNPKIGENQKWKFIFFLQKIMLISFGIKFVTL